MQKRGPVIIVPDYTNDELYGRMCQKINAVQDLKWANEARTEQVEDLSAPEQDITRLEKSSGIKHCQNGYIPMLIASQRG